MPMKRERNWAFLLFVASLIALLLAGAYQAMHHEETRSANSTSP
jgi:hypothetical protein